MKARLLLFLGVLAAFALALPAPALASIQLHPHSETTVGGTGYQPVPPGHWPGGMGEQIAWERAARNSSRLASVPSGRLPLGTGRLPVPPADDSGHRVKKTISGGATYYVVEDRNPTGYAQVLEELTQAYAVAPASKARS